MYENFQSTLDPRWSQTCIGLGTLDIVDGTLRMGFPPIPPGTYADAQIDDYGTLPRAHFPWRPPLRMEVRARASLRAATPDDTDESSGILRGTAGFGFWNYPFSVRGDILMLPETVWFFYASPPSNMALVPGIPGWGWKAQVIHSMRPGALLAGVPTALTMGLGKLTGNREAAARWMQRLSGAQEVLLDVPLTSWHTYTLEWQMAEARFWVDGSPVLRVPQPPTRALGFVAWLDNQFAVATPQGTLRFGATPTDAQWFELATVKIEPL